MQIRLFGTEEENVKMIEILQSALENKIKIISPPYSSRNNNTQRIYIEIDLENRNYRKEEFSEKEFFDNLTKRFSP